MTRTKNTFAFAATGTQLTSLIHENGSISLMVIEVPNFTNTITITVTVLDTDGDTLWESGSLAKNSTVRRTGLSIPVDYGYTIQVDLSGVAGGSGGTVTVKNYVQTEDRR